MNDTNLMRVMIWKDGTRKGMGANLFVFVLLMFVAQMLLGAFGHPAPQDQLVTIAALQVLLGLAAGLVAGGAISDKKHEREMKKLDIQATQPPPAAPAVVVNNNAPAI